MRHPNINTRLIDLAETIIHDKLGDYPIYLENEGGFVAGSISWTVTHGFELHAEIEAWGRYYPATLYCPAEQDTNHVDSLYLVTPKIQAVADLLAEYGHTL